ncbi:unnamed protein product [Adineta steineri]|uniref:F-box domain-containing protein n=1 Tax=Adineta steineri TaxID=433720 RepID=A0A815LVK7_9BILA|nr:unnamed protein product [Adineta steineri]CAF3962513.1 unnamed protein product [Adineta steineri]
MDQIRKLNNNKRQKLSVKTRKFEDLSNAIVYEIFEYLYFHESFHSFYDLNQRFQHLFIHSNYPIQINISSISKSLFQRYLINIIIPQCHRIKSFSLSNPLISDIYPQVGNCTQLQSIILDQVQSSSIESILDSLYSLPKLTSLTIKTIDKVKKQKDIYLKVFRLPFLRYCELSIETSRILYLLPVATNQLSSIEYLTIKNSVSLAQLYNLLSYVPRIRHLSFKNLYKGRYTPQRLQSIHFDNLTSVSLKFQYFDFDVFELLIQDFFQHVQILCFSARDSSMQDEYLDTNCWEELITNHLPNLRIFDFQYECAADKYNTDTQQHEVLVNQFNSSFWTKRQCFLQHRYYHKYYDRVVFYSINSHKQKYHLLTDPLTETNVDFINHLEIEKISSRKELISYFPNVTQLTLSETFHLPRNFISDNFHKIIPLKQLTKLNLHCLRFSFERIIDLLSLTSNVQILEFDSLLFNRKTSLSIEQSEMFQFVSKTNRIKQLTIKKEISFDKIKLCVHLFSRLESLTINLYEKDLKSIVRFILLESNKHIRHLSSLYILKQEKRFLEKVKKLIDSEELLRDYQIKLINKKVYLWW